MSLAIYAAPFNENSDNHNNSINDDQDSLMNKRRQAHNKTQKKYPKENFDSKKVNSILETIHNNSSEDDDNNLGDFAPPPMPQSAGVNKTIATEQSNNLSNQNNEMMFKALGRAPQPNYDGGNNLDLNDYNIYGDNKTVDEYYKKVLPSYTVGNNMNNLPNYTQTNKPYYNSYMNKSSEVVGGQDILLQKLNYMINLLEEQQDEKTNNVTEEVVLYSFLGIFIIFVIDSFARVGKYVR